MHPEQRQDGRATDHPIPNIPVFDHLGTPPGRWVPGSTAETFRWDGLLSWITQQGRSTVRYYMGEISTVWNLTSSDDKTIPVATLAAPYDRTSWQRIDETGARRTGWLELTEDGIIFHDNPIAAQRPATGLAEILAVDGEFRARVGDKVFVDTVCGYLAENVFRRIEGEERMTFGARSAEDFLLRVSGVEADRHNRDVRAMVAFEEILEETGWHAMTPEEIEADRQSASDLLMDVEGRPDATIPDDARPNVIPLRSVGDGNRFGRLLAHAAAGRVSQAELDRFTSLDHPAQTSSHRLRPVG